MICQNVKLYRSVKCSVIQNGYLQEIAWQANRDFCDITETDFLREGAWVILSSGMKESVIRKIFPAMSDCYYSWESAEKIVEHADHCRRKALGVFNHRGKIAAISDLAFRVVESGFSDLKSQIAENPMVALETLPYIGPVTSYHLAKNLGIAVAKPDRHLVRIARHLGYDDVQDMCLDLSEASGDSVPVVDVVLWRYATIRSDYLHAISAFLERSQQQMHSRS
jgi:hypothetical protein